MSIRHMSAIWDSQLYDGPKLLMMLALADWADADGRSYPHYDTLAKRIRRNVKTVYRVLADLESSGAIRRAGSDIYITEPEIVQEVARRQEESDTKQGQKPRLKSEKGVLKTENGSANPILNSENEILNNEKPILISENGILKIEKPFFIDPSADPSSTRQEPPTATAAAEPPAAAAVAADLLQPILDWSGFDDTLKPKERVGLDVATLLGWAYWARLKQAERGSRIINPGGWMRSQWRGGRPLRADLLRLARGWLLLDDDGRARLLGRLEWCIDFGGHTDVDFERDFPDIPPALAAAVHTATGGEFGPPSLMPIREATTAAITEVCAGPPPASSLATRDWPLWKDALAELEGQMDRATFTLHLAGTTATLSNDVLTIHCRNAHTAVWLEQRLHSIIARTVTAIAGQPTFLLYEAAEPTEPTLEAQHG